MYNYKKLQGLQRIILFVVKLFANVERFGFFTINLHINNSITNNSTINKTTP